MNINIQATISEKLAKTPIDDVRLLQIIDGYATVPVMDKAPNTENWQYLKPDKNRSKTTITSVKKSTSTYPNGMGLVLNNNLLAIDFDVEDLWPKYYGNDEALLPNTLQIIGNRKRCQLIYKITPWVDSRWVLLNRLKEFIVTKDKQKIEFRHGNKQSVIYGFHSMLDTGDCQYYAAYDDSGDGIIELKYDDFEKFILDIGVPKNLVDGVISGDAATINSKKMVVIDPEGAFSQDEKFDVPTYNGLIKVAQYLQTHNPDFELKVNLLPYLSKKNYEYYLNGSPKNHRNNNAYKLAMDYHALYMIFLTAGYTPEKTLYEVLVEYGAKSTPPITMVDDYKEFRGLEKINTKLMDGDVDDPRYLGTSKFLTDIAHDFVGDLTKDYNYYLRTNGIKTSCLRYISVNDNIEEVIVSPKEKIDSLMNEAKVEYNVNLDVTIESFVETLDKKRFKSLTDVTKFIPEQIRNNAINLYGGKYYGWVMALTSAINAGLYAVAPRFGVRDTHITDTFASRNAPWSVIVAPSGVGKSDFTEKLFTLYNTCTKKIIKGEQRDSTKLLKNSVYKMGGGGALKVQDFPAGTYEYKICKFLIDNIGHSNLQKIIKDNTDFITLSGYVSYEQFVTHINADRIKYDIKREFKFADDIDLRSTNFYEYIFPHGAVLILDELSQIFNFGEYKKNTSSDMQTLLVLKKNTTFERDLKSENSFADNVSVGMYGGIQPGIFQTLGNTSQTQSSGFLNRFIYSPLYQNPNYSRNKDGYLSEKEVFQLNLNTLTLDEKIQMDFALAALITYCLGVMSDEEKMTKPSSSAKLMLPDKYILNTNSSQKIEKYINTIRTKYAKTALKDSDPLNAYYKKLPPELLLYSALYSIQHYVMGMIPKVKEKLNFDDESLMEMLTGNHKDIIPLMIKTLELCDFDPINPIINEEAFDYACVLLEQSVAEYSKLISKSEKVSNSEFYKEHRLEQTRLDLDHKYRNNQFSNDVITKFKKIFESTKKSMSAAAFINRMTPKTKSDWKSWARNESESNPITKEQLKSRVEKVLEDYIEIEGANFSMKINNKKNKSFMIVDLVDENETIQDVAEPLTTEQIAEQAMDSILSSSIGTKSESAVVNSVSSELPSDPQVIEELLAPLPPQEIDIDLPPGISVADEDVMDDFDFGDFESPSSTIEEHCSNALPTEVVLTQDYQMEPLNPIADTTGGDTPNDEEAIEVDPHSIHSDEEIMDDSVLEEPSLNVSSPLNEEMEEIEDEDW